MFPKARADKLTIRELAEETLIYDQERHKAHCLNATAQMVWRRCDGKTAVDAIARIVAAELGIGQAGDIVRLAVDQLARRHLLDNPVPLPQTSPVTRRKALKKLALAAVILPLVMTIATKTAAQSMSGGGGSSSSAPQVNINANVTVVIPPKQAPAPPCRSKGQSCVAAGSGQQGTCCAGLKCNGVADNAGVCG